MATGRGGLGRRVGALGVRLVLAAAPIVAGTSDAGIGEGAAPRSVTGVVRAAASGAPLAGARVEIAVRRRGRAGAFERLGVASDDDGRFNVTPPTGASPIGLVARLDGYGAATRVLTKRSVVPVVVELRRGGALRVRLVAAETSPRGAVAAETVECARSDLALEAPLWIPLTNAAGGGVHTTELEPGAYAVVARAPGCVAEVLLDVAIAAGTAVERSLALRPQPPARKARCGAE